MAASGKEVDALCLGRVLIAGESRRGFGSLLVLRRSVSSSRFRKSEGRFTEGGGVVRAISFFRLRVELLIWGDKFVTRLNLLFRSRRSSEGSSWRPLGGIRRATGGIRHPQVGLCLRSPSVCNFFIFCSSLLCCSSSGTDFLPHSRWNEYIIF